MPPGPRAVERGLAAITLGLVASSAYVLTTAADRDWVAYAVTLVTAACVAGTRLNPFLAARRGGGRRRCRAAVGRTQLFGSDTLPSGNESDIQRYQCQASKGPS